MRVKNKINEKHIVIFVVILALIATLVAMYEYSVSSKYREKIESMYQRSFTELVDYIGNINVILNKALVSSDTNHLVSLSEQLWSETALAKSALGQLPINSAELEKTSNFITQVSDYIRMLSKQLLNGKKIEDKQVDEILQLVDFSDSLNKRLKSLEDDFENGNLSISNEQTKAVFSGSSTNISDSVKSIEGDFEKYPTMIYDGPFSEHIINKKPEVNKQKEVTKEHANKVADDFCNLKTDYIGKSNGKIPSYMFSSENDGVFIEVSKNGGQVIMMTDGKSVSNPTIQIDDAKIMANDFLESKGYKNMQQTGYTTDGNIVNFAFAYTQGGYTIYPDLVKVKVSLNDGKICGFEATGYLSNHIERSIPDPLIEKSQILSNLNKILTVEKVNMACIPKDNGEEVWCYEIVAKCKNKTFLIYKNTVSGDEEEILMLIEDEGGSLTI